MRDPKPFGLNELREMFLAFFKHKEHLLLPRFSTMPKDHPSLPTIHRVLTTLTPYPNNTHDSPRHH